MAKKSEPIKAGSNYMVATANRPYRFVRDLEGVGFKSMNVLVKPYVWSATVLVKQGHILPTRKNTGLCEWLVVKGKGQYRSGQPFSEGDYIRENAGAYGSIKAETDLEFFMTNHGSTSFLDEKKDVLWKADADAVSGLGHNDEKE